MLAESSPLVGLVRLDTGFPSMVEIDGAVYRFTMNALKLAPAGLGQTVSQMHVDRDHIWYFNNRNSIIAANNVTETIGFIGLLGMDFSERMAPLTSISSITATSVADVVGATEPTISSLASRNTMPAASGS